MTGKETDRTFAFQRIALIIVYFGNVPWYFKFFNKSCSYNPDVDFILITDMKVTEGLADNITVVRSSLEEISKQATSTLGFEISMISPYKLCDLRPAYGLIFSDLIKGYDFWGYCDMDLVFGNIRSLITSDILNRFDVVSVKKEYMAGFFSLFRNKEKINNIFKKSKDYKRVFQEPVYYDFDECNWEWHGLLSGKDIAELDSAVDSITHVIKMAERSGDITVYWHSMEYHPEKIVWDRGELIYNKNERVLLCHFIYLKNLNFRYVPKWKTVPERFYMNPFYISGHALGSPADRLLRSLLGIGWLAKRIGNMLGQYTQWVVSYLFASRQIDFNGIQHPAELVGDYWAQKRLINLYMVNRRLHADMQGLHFPLLHKGAGKFVLAKCTFQGLVNVEFDFHFNESISAYILQVTGSGHIKHTYFKTPFNTIV